MVSAQALDKQILSPAQNKHPSVGSPALQPRDRVESPPAPASVATTLALLLSIYVTRAGAALREKNSEAGKLRRS